MWIALGDARLRARKTADRSERQLLHFLLAQLSRHNAVERSHRRCQQPCLLFPRLTAGVNGLDCPGLPLGAVAITGWGNKTRLDFIQ
ncbi:unnamed protein product [Lota lota]